MFCQKLDLVEHKGQLWSHGICSWIYNCLCN